jgi:molybdopterin synthase catalytic subunit
MEARMQQTHRGERDHGRPEADGALVRRPIDPQRLLAAVPSPEAGANVLFVGTVRDVTGAAATTRLEYEAHTPLARAELARLCREAADRFELVAVAVSHRLGVVEPGDAGVAVARGR